MQELDWGIAMKYTHKGWFFMCPVYLNADDGEEMAVEARHEWLEWWFDVNNWIFSVMVLIVSFFNPDYEPMFPFRVTGKL
jgi:hypothetical protein